MAAKGTQSTQQAREPKKQTPTFLLELPLVAGPAQAKRLRAHLEAGRQFYNALLFVLHKGEEGHQGVLIWKEDQIPALIDWKDPVVTYGLAHRIKYTRLIRRPVSSPKAQGADCQGDRYFVQLALQGMPYHKPK